jgi:hypothetical protein
MGQVAVVGEQQEAFTRLIEAADGVDPLGDLRDQIDGPRPAGGIEVGTQVTAGLMDQPVNQALQSDRLAVYADALFARIDLRAELAHNPPIDGDTAGTDERFALPARANTGMGQEFVETFHESDYIASSRLEGNSKPEIRNPKQIRKIKM